MTDPIRQFFERYGAFDPAESGHWLLLVLIDSIIVLTLFTIIFAVAAMLLRLQYNRHERKWQHLHRKWDRDLLEVLGGEASAEDFRLLVEKGQELDFVRFLAPYGYRLRGSDLERLATLARRYLPFVVERLQHPSPGVRLWAINVLDLFGMPAYEEAVASRLSDKSPAVAMFAATTLLSHQCIHYIEQIIDQLPRFDKWNINALASLLVRAGPAVQALLQEVYMDSRRPMRTRVIAAEALGRGNAYQALNAALLTLGSENNQDILVATLHLLACISQGNENDAVRALCRSPNDVLRINAMNTLRQLAKPIDLPLFHRGLEDSNPWVARHAAMALRDLGDTDTLRKVADDAQHPRAAVARYVLALG